MLAYGRRFSPSTPVSSTIKTGRHDIADILLKAALSSKNQSIRSNKKQKLYTIASTFVYARFLVGSVLLIYSVFCVVFFVCLWSNPCVLHVEVVFGLSILDWPFGFLWSVHSWSPVRFPLNAYLSYVLCTQWLKMSLDCPFLIDPSVFSGLSILDFPVGFLLTFICPMSCVLNVASVFGLSILDWPFGFL